MKGCHEKGTEQLFPFSLRTEGRGLVPARHRLEKRMTPGGEEQGVKSLVRVAGPCVFDWTRRLESLTV